MMPHAALSEVVARASRATKPATAETDGELLTRFVRLRDEHAFADLVRRLGPTVLGTCRRVTRDADLAEDAFQAAFVVLARRGADVRPPEAVRGWLYGVAVRAAREARAVALRRSMRERPVAQVPDRAAEERERPDADALCALGEAVGALPDHLRVAVVLCELDGLSRRVAAERLGVPEGTLSSRLAKARRLLAERLRGRGVAAPVAGLAALTQTVVPAELIARTAARLDPTVPLLGAVATISNRMLRVMLLHKLSSGSVWVVAFVAACLGAWMVTPRSTANGAPKPGAVALRTAPPEGKKPAAIKPAGAGRILVWKETKYVFLDADGKEERAFDTGHPDKEHNGGFLSEPFLSPDRKLVAFRATERFSTDDYGQHLYVRGTETKEPGVKIDLSATAIAWDADSKGLIVTEHVPAKTAKEAGYSVLRVDIATKEKVKLDLPKYAVVHAVMPNGKAFVAALSDFDAKTTHLALVSRDGKEVIKLCEVRLDKCAPRPSPDGTKILFQDFDAGEKPAKDMPRLPRLFVYNLKSKERERVEEVPENALLIGYCWSPDGKRLAYTWKQVQPGVPLALNLENLKNPKVRTETESHLIVCDADGKNAKTVVTCKAEDAPAITLGEPDWR